jgi:hypothetical protein
VVAATTMTALDSRTSETRSPVGTMQTTVIAGLLTQGATRTCGTTLGMTGAVHMGVMLDVGNVSNIRGTGFLDQELT